MSAPSAMYRTQLLRDDGSRRPEGEAREDAPGASLLGTKLVLVRPDDSIDAYAEQAAECLISEVFPTTHGWVRTGFDEGKVGCKVVETFRDHLVLEVVRAPNQGPQAWQRQGINFPGSDLSLNALTERDLRALDSSWTMPTSSGIRLCRVRAT